MKHNLHRAVSTTAFVFEASQVYFRSGTKTILTKMFPGTS